MKTFAFIQQNVSRIFLQYLQNKMENLLSYKMVHLKTKLERL